MIDENIHQFDHFSSVLFLAVENKLNETIKNAGNIQDVISLLEVKQALSPSLHIPTMIVILNGIAASAPQDMKDKVMKKVKSSIDSGTTEREMNRIAKAMGNDYYAIDQAHKHLLLDLRNSLHYPLMPY